MDNETSELVKQIVRTGSLTLELTPASQHRRNTAERAIRSFKNHFIASMSGVDQDSPKDLWSDYDEQIEETLNLLRRGPSGKSAWEGLFGPRDFNAVPIAPIGIKVVAHVPRRSAPAGTSTASSATMSVPRTSITGVTGSGCQRPKHFVYQTA